MKAEALSQCTASDTFYVYDPDSWSRNT